MKKHHKQRHSMFNVTELQDIREKKQMGEPERNNSLSNSRASAFPNNRLHASRLTPATVSKTKCLLAWSADQVN